MCAVYFPGDAHADTSSPKWEFARLFSTKDLSKADPSVYRAGQHTQSLAINCFQLEPLKAHIEPPIWRVSASKWTIFAVSQSERDPCAVFAYDTSLSNPTTTGGTLRNASLILSQFYGGITEQHYLGIDANLQPVLLNIHEESCSLPSGLNLPLAVNCLNFGSLAYDFSNIPVVVVVGRTCPLLSALIGNEPSQLFDNSELIASLRLDGAKTILHAMVELTKQEPNSPLKEICSRICRNISQYPALFHAKVRQ